MVEALRAMLTVGNSAAPSIERFGGNAAHLADGHDHAQRDRCGRSDDAVGFARTVNQVHHIVYGSATVGVSKGGFFPSGTNSIFATTTTA